MQLSTIHKSPQFKRSDTSSYRFNRGGGFGGGRGSTLGTRNRGTPSNNRSILCSDEGEQELDDADDFIDARIGENDSDYAPDYSSDEEGDFAYDPKTKRFIPYSQYLELYPDGESEDEFEH